MAKISATVAIIMLGPKVGVGARIDQLRIHPNSPARALHTAFDHMRNTQSFCDLAKVAFRAAFVFHHARAADDFQVSDLGEISQNFVLHASGEKCVLFFLAQIFKRQNGDAFFTDAGGTNFVSARQSGAARPDPGAEARRAETTGWLIARVEAFGAGPAWPNNFSRRFGITETVAKKV